MVGAAAEQVCAADESRRCAGALGRRLAEIQRQAAFRGAGLSLDLFFSSPFYSFSLMKLWQILVHAAVNVILQLVDKKRDRAGK